MVEKKYLSLGGLQKYDALFKQNIRAYVDEQVENAKQVLVTVNQSTGKASMTSSEIFTAIGNGNTVILALEIESRVAFLSIYGWDSRGIWFSLEGWTSEGFGNLVACIDDEGSIYTEQAVIPTLNNLTTAINSHNTDSAAHADIRNEIVAIKDSVNTQPDYAQNDSAAPDYIKNRTHWVEYVQADILPETTITITDGQYQSMNPVGLQRGESYVVVWNGTEYECECKYIPASEELPETVFLGNSLFAGSEDDTGEPFIVIEISAYGVFGVMTYSDGDYTISISGAVESVHKIDEKFLPSTTWDYLGLRGVEIFNDIVTGFAEGSVNLSTAEFELKAEQQYEVIWDGVSYDVIATEFDSAITDHTIAIGNALVLNGESATEEPFAIVYNLDQNICGFAAIDVTNGDINTSIDAHKVVIKKKVINPIPEQYLPENVVMAEELVENISGLQGQIDKKADINHSHDYADIDHNHSYNDLTDKPTIPSIEGLAKESYVDSAIVDHNHNDTYYTRAEIDDARDSFATKADIVNNNHNYFVAYSDDGVNYTGTIEGITNLNKGQILLMTPNIANTSNSGINLNINNLGNRCVNRPMYNSNDKYVMQQNWLVVGKFYVLVYDGFEWRVISHEMLNPADLRGQVSIYNGGTGSSNAEEARAKLGITPENIGAATSGHSHSYNDLTDKPSIPSTEGLATETYVNERISSNPPVVYQAEAPTDTSVIWVDMDDDSDDGLAEAINEALLQAKASGEFDGMSAEERDKLNNTNIAYGTCSTAADVAEKAVVLESNAQWSLTKGSIIMVKFNVSNTAEAVTINVNGTGAYPIWYNNAEYTSTGTAYTGYANRTITYMFNGTHYVWITASYDANSTYTNAALGQGYATCSTAAATAAKVGTLSSYKLVTGGIVSVKFTNAVPANATLNINSTGAKSMYFRGAKITADVIKAGDVATFVYSSYYHLISIDRWQNDISSLQTQVGGLATTEYVDTQIAGVVDSVLAALPTWTGGSY